MTYPNGAPAVDEKGHPLDQDGNRVKAAPPWTPPGADIRIRFGPRPTQVVPLAWAEIMLTELKTRQPVLFGKLLIIAADLAK